MQAIWRGAALWLLGSQIRCWLWSGLRKVSKFLDLPALADSWGSTIDLNRCKGFFTCSGYLLMSGATRLLHKTVSLMPQDTFLPGDPDNINFAFTLYCGEGAAAGSAAHFWETAAKTEVPRQRLITFYSWVYLWSAWTDSGVIFDSLSNVIYSGWVLVL